LKKNQLRHQSWSAGINRMMTMEFQYSDIDCIWMMELEETFELSMMDQINQMCSNLVSVT